MKNNIYKRDENLYYPCDEYGNIEKSEYPKEPHCPVCGSYVWRDSVDVGVGIIHGPWGCGDCGWSSDPYYDCRSGPCPAEQEDDNEYVVNQFGHLFKDKFKNRKEDRKGDRKDEF